MFISNRNSRLPIGKREFSLSKNPCFQETKTGALIYLGQNKSNISEIKELFQLQFASFFRFMAAYLSLTHALAVSLAGKVRVNSISPGWIDTAYTVYEGPDAIQQPAGRVGNPLDIANMVLFLASEKAGFITGENICIDGGQTKLMIYHGDHGWTLNP